jgi:hypothetical protein
MKSFNYLDARSKAKVWNAYADNFESEYIIDEGFNPSNGVVYIALENGIHICSSYSKSEVFFAILNNSDDGQISFYRIEELNEYLNKIKL